MGNFKHILLILVLGAFFLSIGGIAAYILQPSSEPKMALQEMAAGCLSDQLSARALLEPVGETLAGSVILTNSSPAPCEIAGTPSVELYDASNTALAAELRALTEGVKEATIILHSGESAFAQIIWANWCGEEKPPFGMLVTIPDSGETVHAPTDIESVPSCDEPNSLSTVYAGPFIFSSGPPLVPIRNGE